MVVLGMLCLAMLLEQLIGRISSNFIVVSSLVGLC